MMRVVIKKVLKVDEFRVNRSQKILILIERSHFKLIFYFHILFFLNTKTKSNIKIPIYYYKKKRCITNEIITLTRYGITSFFFF